jgi:hypothetical protein
MKTGRTMLQNTMMKAKVGLYLSASISKFSRQLLNEREAP